MIAHTDHAVMVLTRSTFTPVFAPRIAALFPGALFARAIVTRAVLARALIAGTVVAGAILTRPIFPRTIVAAAVVTTTILTAITAAFGPGWGGLLSLGHDGNFDHRLGGHGLQRCDFGVRFHRPVAPVSVAVAAARTTRFIARAVGPV
jgi:hypothetical protein